MYDFLIIGAGIVGSFIAHDLAKYDVRVGVVEKANDVACGATMANSAIIHAGHDPIEGTLKAKLNVRGSVMYEDICKELGVDYKRIGAYVVSCSEEENKQLDVLYKQAVDRKIPVSFKTQAEIRDAEKNISDGVIKALYLPTTAIVTPWNVAIALMENAIDNGVKLFLNNTVSSITKKEGYFEVQCGTNTYKTKSIVNCAGVYADEIYKMISNNVKFDINARKGEYFVLDKSKDLLVKHVIYPLPSSIGKGVLVVPTIHNNILLGPNSDISINKEGINNTTDALNYVKKEVARSVKNVPLASIIRTFAGLRPSGTTHDFIIEEASDTEFFYNVAAIESPGLASAPAISEYLINEIIAKKIKLTLRKDYNRYRRPYIDLNSKTKEARDALVKENGKYAKIICRCEQISEGEIIDVINRSCGATTIKGVKKRAGAGMGRCQGGFCEPRVIEILARELGVDKMDILLDSLNSKVLIERTKE